MDVYKKDHAFAGLTHALSTLATVTLVAAFFPQVFAFLFNYPEAQGKQDYSLDLSLVILCVVCTVGSCMLPDLDNTKSRAESSLGFIGSGLSAIFRTVASVVQSTIRMPKDDSTPNPHRGFWHSPLGALTLAVPLFLIGSQADSDNNVNFANIVLMLTVFMLAYLSMYAVFSKQLTKKQKAKKNSLVFKIIPYLFAFAVSGIMFFTQGVEIFSYSWPIAASVFFGMMLHTFGDCHTTSGAPIFSPLTAITKKKIWWNTSFFSIESGGEFETGVLVKIYGVAAIVGTCALVYTYF